MKIIIKIMLYYFKALIHKIISLLPRNRKVWLYGGVEGKFVDNSKHLFIYANSNIHGIKHVWITSSKDELNFLKVKGFLCFYRNSISGIYYGLCAKVYIYSSDIRDVTHLSLSSGAFLFNLWHGTPLKKIGRDNYLHEMYKIENSLERIFVKRNVLKYIESDAVLCPVEFFKKSFITAFGLKDESNLCFAPYPRTLPLYFSELQLNQHIDRFESPELKAFVEHCKLYSKVWIYMPTWREHNPNFIKEAIKDIDELNEICLKKGILFIMKLHPNSNVDFLISKYSNVILLSNKIDIYPLLPYTTTLLTDYSSVFIDYYILKKEVVFYPFDLLDYKAHSREMYFEYEELAKGKKIYNFNELLNYLNSDDEVHIQIDVNMFCPQVDWKIEDIEKYILSRIN
ncbi:CDP-glycerol glycerophosphotransferase family protein [Flavobacterium branchiicola]|uniref:CDP-glycerol glycerophosphotransferase family protein n=1 Tax=Flavobacterium branchiicola TaxID=1114875 RepID=A0ABV9PCB3_9FLAO|nr:CDP-glycerol glycerophosphotransferase family protein [Flavobacterium branchiicola]MBS7254391.1 CDP-glycerol glycerophosphotransferase family protein [Flavobacterium branchiicola]